jgi:putative endonuclease
MWFVYIVRCIDNSFYTGITCDTRRRVGEHNTNNAIGARYTKYRRPVTLVYSEMVESRSKALKREAQIKKLSRLAKQKLIEARLR